MPCWRRVVEGGRGEGNRGKERKVGISREKSRMEESESSGKKVMRVNEK